MNIKGKKYDKAGLASKARQPDNRSNRTNGSYSFRKRKQSKQRG